MEPARLANSAAKELRLKTFLVIFIAVAAIATAADSGPIVSVTGGQIRGALLDKGGAVFKGIPFAQPPVGDLRWREPMPVTSQNTS